MTAGDQSPGAEIPTTGWLWCGSCGTLAREAHVKATLFRHCPNCGKSAMEPASESYARRAEHGARRITSGRSPASETRDPAGQTAGIAETQQPNDNRDDTDDDRATKR